MTETDFCGQLEPLLEQGPDAPGIVALRLALRSEFDSLTRRAVEAPMPNVHEHDRVWWCGAAAALLTLSDALELDAQNRRKRE